MNKTCSVWLIVSTQDLHNKRLRSGPQEIVSKSRVNCDAHAHTHHLRSASDQRSQIVEKF